MAELPSPGPVETDWPQCRCARCEARRQDKKLAPGCPCPECQPGRGTDYVGNGRVRTATRRAEMALLLKKSDKGTLTASEEARLDGLCHDYLYGN